MLSCLLAIFEKGKISAGLAGLSISYALQLTTNLGTFVKAVTETESGKLNIYIFFIY